jgi:hypothetical protein
MQGRSPCLAGKLERDRNLPHMGNAEELAGKLAGKLADLVPTLQRSPCLAGKLERDRNLPHMGNAEELAGRLAEELVTGKVGELGDMVVVGKVMGVGGRVAGKLARDRKLYPVLQLTRGIRSGHVQHTVG